MGNIIPKVRSGLVVIASGRCDFQRYCTTGLNRRNSLKASESAGKCSAREHVILWLETHNMIWEWSGPNPISIDTKMFLNWFSARRRRNFSIFYASKTVFPLKFEDFSRKSENSPKIFSRRTIFFSSVWKIFSEHFEKSSNFKGKKLIRFWSVKYRKISPAAD